MAKTIFILCCLSLVLLVNGIPFDFFQLVQQWGPNTCNNTSKNNHCYAPPQAKFTIHGLWPSNYTKARLVCPKKKFSKVPTLEPKLNIYWPDLIDGNNSKFWEHEWNQHGACLDPPSTVFDYFSIALKLYPMYNLLGLLSAAGLSPQISKLRVSQDILGPIKAKTNKEAGIRCNNNGKTGQLQLYEIVLCFNKNGVTLIDCPQFVSSSCRFKFVWLLPQQSSVGIPADYP